MSHASAPRYVFDTNTLVSALLVPHSTPRRALDYAFDHGHILISLPLLRELYRVLRYLKLAPYITPAERAQFLNLLTSRGR